MKCHDDAAITQILLTPHAVKGDADTPFGQHDCESCHGASPEHVHSRPPEGALRDPPTVRFSGPHPSSLAERNAVCLGCHENGQAIHWTGSKHANNEVACTACHTVHIQKDPVLVRDRQATVCFSCHTEQRAQSFKPSHHPVREGKVICSDCHNPHGTGQDMMLVKDRINDTCYKCHAEKRGPFLFEHAPVREDCTLCHNPHGSTKPALLTLGVPWLCQECHDGGTHAGNPYNASKIFGNTLVAPAPQAMARGCLNCHLQIHGSNNPSAPFFTR